MNLAPKGLSKMIEAARNYRLPLILLSAIVLGACSSMPPEKRDGMRAELVARANTSLNDFKDAFPEVNEELETAEGHIVAWLETGVLGPVKGVGGQAVLVDSSTNSQTFLDVGKFGLGLGLGGNRYEELMVIQDRATLEKFQKGRWFFDPTAWSAAGEVTHAGRANDESASRYTLNRSGAVLSADVGMVRVKVNKDLNATGVSSLSVPNTGFMESGEENNDVPRVWPYRMPFLGQKVIDQGFDLPIPYGLGLSYVDAQQEVLIQSLAVGFNGSPIVPYDFVSFDDTNVDISSYQLKFDAWLFPFMNVFGLYGKVSGDVRSDVVLDGNTLLDQIGSNCSRLIPPLECFLLRDNTFTLPIRVNVDTTSYGFGTVFAGGWKGWFAVLPISSTYTKGKASVTEGNSLTITPRVGRTFNIGSLGNMAVYVGGNHLDSDLTVTGVFDVPDVDLDIGYYIEQQNVEKWAYVVGFNWDLGRHISWGIEYNGFVDTRETWIATINIRP